MKLTIRLKLLPSPEQKRLLLQTMEKMNTACNFASRTAFEHHTANRVRIHHLTYFPIRERFGLPAALTLSVVRKVANSYQTDRKLHIFRKHGAVLYHPCAFSPKGQDSVSILTTSGRVVVPVVLKSQLAMDLRQLRGKEAWLSYWAGGFYLLASIDVPEAPLSSPNGFLGVDMGIINIAANSDGHCYSGNRVRAIRERQLRLVRKLQKKAKNQCKLRKRPKSVRRVLQRVSRRVHNFVTTTNHTIAKKLVARAKDTGRGIALENLQGVRGQKTASRPQRRDLHSWAFDQLRRFIEYKARLAGVVVVVVNPRNTSITCPSCGNIDKRNRPSRGQFKCTSCGFAGPADVIAAGNIARRATARWPYAAPSLAAASAAS